MSDYARRFEAAMGEIRAAGIPNEEALSTTVRIARRLGLPARPLPYSTRAQILLSGLAVGVVWGAVAWLTLGAFVGSGSTVSFVAIMVVIMSVIGAALTGSQVRDTRRAHQLSDWDAL